ncbi:MAG: putative Ig domain-containing protein, partial [Halanaerobiaceae bacterium]
MSKIKAAILILLVLTVTFSGGLISAEEVDGLEISSQPLTITEEGYSYNYQVRVENQDGEDLNYSLHNAPADMDIDGRGLVTWTPGGERAGEYDIEIRVTTGNGNEVSQDYTLLVAEAINNEPDIISEPKTEVQEGEEYNYEVEAEDADGDNIVYHLSEKPEGMCIDQVSGEIIWEPGMEQTGEHSVRIVASDKDDSSEQSYS